MAKSTSAVKHTKRDGKNRNQHRKGAVKHRGNIQKSSKADMIHKLKQEARHLGLTTDEYVRLILNLSSSLRTGLVEDKQVDGKQVLKWVENPVFLAMLQWISQYAVTTMNGQSSTSKQDDEDPQALPVQPDTNRPAPDKQQQQSRQPMQQQPMQQRPMQQQPMQQQPMQRQPIQQQPMQQQPMQQQPMQQQPMQRQIQPPRQNPYGPNQPGPRPDSDPHPPQ